MQKTHETQVQTLGWEDPPEKEVAATPVFLPEKSHGQRSLGGYSAWDHEKPFKMGTSFKTMALQWPFVFDS